WYGSVWQLGIDLEDHQRQVVGAAAIGVGPRPLRDAREERRRQRLRRQPRVLGEEALQTGVAEEFARRRGRFRKAVGEEDEAVAGGEGERALPVGGAREAPHHRARGAELGEAAGALQQRRRLAGGGPGNARR